MDAVIETYPINASVSPSGVASAHPALGEPWFLTPDKAMRRDIGLELCRHASVLPMTEKAGLKGNGII